MKNNSIQNPRATLGKYRNLTETDWNTVLEAYKAGRGLIRVETSTGRQVMFTRAEVEFLIANEAPNEAPAKKQPLENTVLDGVPKHQPTAPLGSWCLVLRLNGVRWSGGWAA